MRLLLLGLALVTCVAAPALLRADAGPCAAVRGYFLALDRQDFATAIALTDGAAQARTAGMVGDLQRQAASHHARVEIKVRALDVEPPEEPQPGLGVPVPVQFHIDVIGHKWFWHKVARTLDGRARFFVDPDHEHRIVAIEGQLE